MIKNGGNEMATFETGKTYGNNFIGNSDLWFYFEVTRRTDKSVWIKDTNTGEVSRRKIRVYNGVEQCDPFGQYSMSPTLRANKSFTDETVEL